MEVVGNVTRLDPELLQLPEVSPLAMKANPYLAEDLFAQWLSLPETTKLVKCLLTDAKAGTAFNASGHHSPSNASAGNALPFMFPAGSTPPLSPRSVSMSPRVMKRQGLGPSSLGSSLKVVSEPVREVIPQFYFQNGRPPPKDLKEQYLAKVDQIFAGHPDGLRDHELKSVTKELCKLPSFFSTALFTRIDVNCTGVVTR